MILDSEMYDDEEVNYLRYIFEKDDVDVISTNEIEEIMEDTNESNI